MKKGSKKAGKTVPATVQKSTFIFNSIEELIKATETEAPTATGQKEIFSRFYNDNQEPEWTGGINGITQYKELLKNGYLPAVEALELNQVSTGQRWDLQPSLSGQFNDIGAYLEGRPECMGEFLEQDSNKYLTVYIECSIGYKVNATMLMEKAKVIFNAINRIEANGTRVKIVMFTECKTDTNQEFLLMVNLKKFEENFIPSFHGLFIGHLCTVRAIIYSYLSLHSTMNGVGRKNTEAIKPQPDAITLELTDSAEELINKLKAA